MTVQLKNQTNWIICKFGGTSVSSLHCWQNIKTICKTHLEQGLKPVLVCSAASKITNLLVQLLADARNGNYNERFTAIKNIYLNLATALEIDAVVLTKNFQELQQLCDGIVLLNEVSARIHARILAQGELMLTVLGAAYLQQQGLNCHWVDARDHLSVQKQGIHKNYLSAQCDTDFDPSLSESFNIINADLIITQGFIASNEKQETVLLGRGGSDTSAAYFAAKLQAKICEIWTDVPGVYTANPKLIPEARLLTELDYDEVQEIASVGGKVLHPNCIDPLRKHKIPLRVKFTERPEHAGSIVSFTVKQNNLPIKSVITQDQIYLISIDTIRMWQHAGFLADVFACFKKYDISVNLVSTSESNVSVSLDLIDGIDHEKIEALLTELNKFSKAVLIGPCAAISLVGRNIRTVLHQVSDLFSVFESQKIYLLSQAANDLNLTFVVDEAQVERLAKKLHVLLIEQNPKSHALSKSWLEEFGKTTPRATPWWQQKQFTLLEIAKTQSPVYVYDKEQLILNANNLLELKNITQVFYAVKANPNAEILKTFYELGLNFECVSLGEVNLVLVLFPDIARTRILFTPNFADKSEYIAALQLNIHLTIDNIYPLKHWGELFAGKNLMLRIDPGYGSGHHKYVCTGGTESKFGIPLAELEELQILIKQLKINVVGLHTHSGSGILQTDNWHNTALQLTKLLEIFPDVTYINLGGGLGIVERPGQNPLDMAAIDDSLFAIKQAFPQIHFWLEPGRYLVGNAGVILAKVTQIKQKHDLTFIGIETGMNSLIRPMLYGAYHEIINLSKLEMPHTMLSNIVGPICESGDTLGYSRMLPENTAEGDVILIATAGAYGRCMASHYNNREPAGEVMLNLLKF